MKLRTLKITVEGEKGKSTILNKIYTFLQSAGYAVSGDLYYGHSLIVEWIDNGKPKQPPK
jgi:hypothetical protein